MEKQPLFVSFVTQKGGVGKSTFTVFAASWLHYRFGVNVAVVDCDYPQHSIKKQKARDASIVQSSQRYQTMLIEQTERLGRKPYPILSSTPERAMND